MKCEAHMDELEFGNRVAERMWKSEGLFAEAKVPLSRGPSIEDEQKSRFKRICARSCRTSSACSSHFIAGCWRYPGLIRRAPRRMAIQPIVPINQLLKQKPIRTFSTRPLVVDHSHALMCCWAFPIILFPSL